MSTYHFISNWEETIILMIPITCGTQKVHSVHIRSTPCVNTKYRSLFSEARNEKETSWFLKFRVIINSVILGTIIFILNWLHEHRKLNDTKAKEMANLIELLLEQEEIYWF